MGCSALISRTETSCAIIDWSCSARSCSLALWFAGNWQEELELWWKLVFGIKSVWEVNSSNSAVSVDLYSQSLNIVGTVGSPGEIRQVELNLVPSLIESHWHCANEWLYTSRWLVVWGSESTSHLLVIQHLHFESEVFLQVLDDHDQERQLDGKCLLWVKRSVDVVCGHVGSHNFKNWWLNIWICDSLNVAVSHLLVPNLQWFWSKSTQLVLINVISKNKEVFPAQNSNTYPIE